MNEILVFYAQHIGETHHTTSVCCLFYTSCHITSFIFYHASPKGGPGQLSWYSDLLLAGRPRDRIPVGGEIFRTRAGRPWGPPSVPYNGYRVFPGGKAAGNGVDHPPPSSAEVKERVELYLYSPSEPLWPVLG